MSLKLWVSVISLSFLPFVSQAQTIAGYDFDKYKVPVYTGKKAPLKLGEWSDFRTRLREAHKDGEVGFGGHYIVSTWGCGAGCLSGAMIDKKTGLVYDLPIGEETPIEIGCYETAENSDDDRVVFYPDSRLFISRNCESEEIANSKQAKQTKTYFVNVWNEKTKKFDLIKEVKKTQIVNTDE